MRFSEGSFNLAPVKNQIKTTRKMKKRQNNELSQATDLLLAQIIETEIFYLVQDDIKHCKICLDIYQDFAKIIISKS